MVIEITYLRTLIRYEENLWIRLVMQDRVSNYSSRNSSTY
jgi:hypothetical protein